MIHHLKYVLTRHCSNVQSDPGADTSLPPYLQHPSGRPLLPHAGGVLARTMAQQGRTRGRTQHGRFHTVLVRADELCG